MYSFEVWEVFTLRWKGRDLRTCLETGNGSLTIDVRDGEGRDVIWLQFSHSDHLLIYLF